MSNDKISETLEGRALHVIGECAKLQFAITKMLRFGLMTCYPLGDPTNAEKVVSEGLDVLKLCGLLNESIKERINLEQMYEQHIAATERKANDVERES